MFKKLRLVTVAVAIALGLGLVVATPAQASVLDCPAGKYCVWYGTNHGGTPAYYWTVPGGSGGFCVNYGGSLNDNIDSTALKGGRSVTQYRDANCSGNTVSFHYSEAHGYPFFGSCGGAGWACLWDGGGSWLPSSAWIIK